LSDPSLPCGCPNDPSPYVQQSSFGVQLEIGLGFVAEADYVGTKSTHLDVLSDFRLRIHGILTKAAALS